MANSYQTNIETNYLDIEVPEEHYAYNIIKNMTADAPEDRMPLSKVIQELSNQVRFNNSRFFKEYLYALLVIIFFYNLARKRTD